MTITGTAAAIRLALADLLDRQPLSALCAADRGTAEIVLAEVFNNIAEHAYCGGGGPIEVSLFADRAGILCTVIDEGLAMPDGRLPRGDRQPAAFPDDLSEGGYGWFLIRTLTTGLHYRRRQGRNELRFRLAPGQ